MTAPQDVLRRMIAEATREPRSHSGATVKEVAADIIGADNALLELEGLAPLLAQHLADALDLLEDIGLYLAVDSSNPSPAVAQIGSLLASVERDLTHPETT